MSVQKFYLGVRSTGIVSAMLRDDEMTTAEELADFSQRMAQSGRTVAHRSLTADQCGKLWSEKLKIEDIA